LLCNQVDFQSSDSATRSCPHFVDKDSAAVVLGTLLDQPLGMAYMSSPKVLGRILTTALKWAVVWALAGAAMGVVATLIEPDTGVSKGECFLAVLLEQPPEWYS
jgi:hypothetical protein